VKALQAVRTTSPLVQQCQKAFNDISIQHAMGLYWVSGHAGVRLPINKQGAALFWGSLDLRVSRWDIQKRLSHLLANQHWARWRGLGDTERQASELISGPCLGAKAKFLSFNKTQSRAVTGLLTVHNTLRRHLHLLGLLDSPL